MRYRKYYILLVGDVIHMLDTFNHQIDISSYFIFAIKEVGLTHNPSTSKLILLGICSQL